MQKLNSRHCPWIRATTTWTLFTLLGACTSHSSEPFWRTAGPGRLSSSRVLSEYTPRHASDAESVSDTTLKPLYRETVQCVDINTENWPDDQIVSKAWGESREFSEAELENEEVEFEEFESMFNGDRPQPHRAQAGENSAFPVGKIDYEIGDFTVDAIEGFDGLAQTANGTAEPEFSDRVPPDPNIAVGPGHIVQVVNYAIAFYDKDGAHAQTFSAELGPTGSPSFFQNAVHKVFDPRCIFDHEINRFIVTATEPYSDYSAAYLNFAISDDNDPNGTWHTYRIDINPAPGSTLFWLDYPALGFDSNAYYVSGTLDYLSGTPSPFGGSRFIVLDKDDVKNGSTTTPSQLTAPFGGSSSSFLMQAGQMFGSSPQRCYFADYTISGTGTTANDVRIWTINNPLTTPTLQHVSVSVPQVAGISLGSMGSSGNYQTFSDVRFYNLQCRGTDLYTTQQIGKSSGSTTHGVSRWYHINTNNWPNSGTNPSLVEVGDIEGTSSENYMFPAIYSDAQDNVVVVSGRVSPTEYASIQINGRAASDTAGMMSAPIPIITGSASNIAMGGRWGDYFDIAIDPDDDTTFWVTGEYQDSTGWRTYINSCRYVGASCIPDYNGDGFLNFFDVSMFLSLYNSQDPSADMNNDAAWNFFDISLFLQLYAAGCP